MPASDFIDEWDVSMGSTPPVEEGGVDWRAVNAAVEAAVTARKYQDQLEERAIQFEGKQEYQQLVEGGATPDEALRRTAHKLYFNKPDKFVSAVKPAFTPSMTDVKGGRFAQLGPNRYQFLPERAPRMPQADVDQRKILSSEMDDLRRQVRVMEKPSEKMMDKDADKKIAELSRRIADTEGKYKYLGTNYLNPQPMPEASKKDLTREAAQEFLKQANGDKEKARKLARDAGYSF